jgi:hypothetical protein
MSSRVLAPLPEAAAVHWRPRASGRRLQRVGRIWTGWTVVHTVPFIATAVGLMLLQPLAFPVAAVSLLHAWIIPELYAQRGANVVRPRRGSARPDACAGAESAAISLVGDLVGHDARECYHETGLVLERGRLGVWLVGQAGALLVGPGGRRVHCYCVKVNEPSLPPSDRVAHLLLALRADEEGFATVANLAFSGARWRVRRRLDASQRPALAGAAGLAARRTRFSDGAQGA